MKLIVELTPLIMTGCLVKLTFTFVHYAVLKNGIVHYRADIDGCIRFSQKSLEVIRWYS